MHKLHTLHKKLDNVGPLIASNTGNNRALKRDSRRADALAKVKPEY